MTVGDVVDLIHSAALVGLCVAYVRQSQTVDVIIRRLWRTEE
jgi:hypothetical protein